MNKLQSSERVSQFFFIIFNYKSLQVQLGKVYFFHRRDQLRRLILWLSYLLNRQIYQEKFKQLERLIVKISVVD